MLAGERTAELARERIADLHRQAERQRLSRLARAQRRGGQRWRLAGAALAGRSATRSGRGVLESSTTR
jgi:hypothetical protein